MAMESNKIYLGDCMEYMKEWIKDDKNWFKFDLCVTDPPYEVNYNDKSTNLEKLGKARQKQIDRDKKFIGLKEFNKRKFCQYLYLLMKKDSHVYIWCAEKQLIEWIKYMEDTKFKFNQILVWVKNAPTFDMTRGLKYSYQHELCLFFRKGVKKLNYPESSIYHVKVNKSMEHPTIKPINLILKQVKNSSKSGDIVFDPFLGSGTTAVASKLTDRKYVGCEISEYFYKLCHKRLSKETIEKQIKLK